MSKGLPLGGLAIAYHIHPLVSYMLISALQLAIFTPLGSCQLILYSCIYKILCYSLTFSKK